MFRKIIAVKYKLNKLGKAMEKLCMHELRNWEKSEIEGERESLWQQLPMRMERGNFHSIGWIKIKI